MTVKIDADNQIKIKEFKKRFNEEKNDADNISQFTGKGRLVETYQNIVNEAIRKVTYEDIYYN